MQGLSLGDKNESDGGEKQAMLGKFQEEQEVFRS